MLEVFEEFEENRTTQHHLRPSTSISITTRDLHAITTTTTGTSLSHTQVTTSPLWVVAATTSNPVCLHAFISPCYCVHCACLSTPYKSACTGSCASKTPIARRYPYSDLAAAPAVRTHCFQCPVVTARGHLRHLRKPEKGARDFQDPSIATIMLHIDQQERNSLHMLHFLLLGFYYST